MFTIKDTDGPVAQRETLEDATRCTLQLTAALQRPLTVENERGEQVAQTQWTPEITASPTSS